MLLTILIISLLLNSFTFLFVLDALMLSSLRKERQAKIHTIDNAVRADMITLVLGG
jgi:hypothetical protein